MGVSKGVNSHRNDVLDHPLTFEECIGLLLFASALVALIVYAV